MKNTLFSALVLLAVAAAIAQSNAPGDRRASDTKIGTTPAPDYKARALICPECNPEVRLVSGKTFTGLVRHVLNNGTKTSVDETVAARADLQGFLLEIDGFQFYWYRDYLLDKDARIKYSDVSGKLELVYRYVNLTLRKGDDEWEQLYARLLSLNTIITEDLEVDMSSVGRPIKDALGIK